MAQSKGSEKKQRAPKGTGQMAQAGRAMVAMLEQETGITLPDELKGLGFTKVVALRTYSLQLIEAVQKAFANRK